MNINLLRLEALRYQRAYGLTVDALHTLSCAPGGMKERLQRIDLEFFTLSSNDLPESGGVRERFGRLHGLVTSKDARCPGEGRVAATLDQLHHTKLKSIAQIIWDIHAEFSAFMRSDDTSRCSR